MTTRICHLLLLGGLFLALPASEQKRTLVLPAIISLQSPLTTTVALPWQAEQGRHLYLRIRVPADAPRDLGIGAFCTDREGSWFQALAPGPLRPGEQELRFDLSAGAQLRAEPVYRSWQATAAAEAYRAGIFLWSAGAPTGTANQVDLLAVEWRTAPAVAPPAPGGQALRDLQFQDINATADEPPFCALQTGQRWTLTCRPDPFPADPFAIEDFRLEAVISDARGKEIRLRAFYIQPMHFVDRGTGEEAIPRGDAHFAIRWRPTQPGRYRLRLEASWQGGEQVRIDKLPTLHVDGELWDDYVRVDAVDPRFFSTGQATGTSRFFWPTGLNIRSINDPRGTQRTGSRLTPDRGMFAYEAYLRRLAAGGGNVAEIWMSSWNLALEWREDWPGFRGIGRYNQANAARLDRLLDLARELDLRINLVIRNHGMGSYRTDKEWHNNPWNASLKKSTRDKQGDAIPGPITRAESFFTDPVALAGQDQMRQYIIARYADHPAILGWKLWTEQNLTAGRPYDRQQWHIQAGDRWHALDPYRHPVTSHWSGNYRTPDRSIVRLDQLDYICIDAYHGTAPDPSDSLADLIWAGTQHPTTGLARFDKPIVITEYGGNWNACPLPQLRAEHSYGAWACLVSGYGSGPMLWWFEWVDQNQLYAPYAAVQRFLVGEDLRSQPGQNGAAKAAGFTTSSAHGELWARGWYRKGRLLGYCLDRRWAWNGDRIRHEAASLVIGDKVAAGLIAIEWWHADLGKPLGPAQTIEHPGGKLTVTAPPFDSHVAFKLMRLPNEAL